FWLRFRGSGERQGEDASAHLGLDPVGVEILGKREGPLEITLAIFGIGKFQVFWPHRLNLAADRQHAVFECDFDRIGGDPRHFEHHGDTLIGLDDIGQRAVDAAATDGLGRVGRRLFGGLRDVGAHRSSSSQAALTSIFFGFSASGREMTIRNTPFVILASTLSSEAANGRRIARENLPYPRSLRCQRAPSGTSGALRSPDSVRTLSLTAISISPGSMPGSSVVTATASAPCQTFTAGNTARDGDGQKPRSRSRIMERISAKGSLRRRCVG